LTDVFNLGKSKKITVSGYAHELGDVKNNPMLIEEAEQLGRQIVENWQEGN